MRAPATPAAQVYVYNGLRAYQTEVDNKREKIRKEEERARNIAEREAKKQVRGVHYFRLGHCD